MFAIARKPKSIEAEAYRRLRTNIEYSSFDDKYKVITHYIENGLYKTFVSETIYNKEQIEELIQAYLDEFNFEKSIFYK